MVSYIKAIKHIPDGFTPFFGLQESTVPWIRRLESKGITIADDVKIAWDCCTGLINEHGVVYNNDISHMILEAKRGE